MQVADRTLALRLHLLLQVLPEKEMGGFGLVVAPEKRFLLLIAATGSGPSA